MNTEPNKTENARKTGWWKRLLTEAPRRLLPTLLHNWPWKLLAILLAVCLWAGLITQDPTLTRERVFSDVTLAVNNADVLRRNSGLVVISGLEEENLNVRLRVDVPQRVYNNVTASNYSPRVDLSRITEAGEQTLKISTTSTTTYGSVQDVAPDTITVMVDEYVTNYRVPVSVNVTGDYPDGFYGSSISLDPSVVAVSGPKTIVDQVARVVVDFDVSRLSARAGTVRSARSMRFVDLDGNDVDSSMLEATSADVVLRTIIVEQTLYPLAEVTVNAASMVEGDPAEGYRVRSVEISPSVLTVAGAEDVLASVAEVFASNPVSLSKAEETFTETVRIRKPSGVEYLSADTVTVTVEIEPVTVSRTFDAVKLFARGTGSGQKVSLEKKTLSAVVTGPQLLLDSLRAAKVTAYVDVSGLTAGEYVLPAELHVEDTDMADLSWLITPATVVATITEN